MAVCTWRSQWQQICAAKSVTAHYQPAACGMLLQFMHSLCVVREVSLHAVTAPIEIQLSQHEDRQDSAYVRCIIQNNSVLAFVYMRCG
jgi:hypothetical protein